MLSPVLRIISRIWSAGVFFVPGDTNSIFFTFDDGPQEETTLRLLDILDSYEVCAVFFVIGEKVRRNPELLREIKKRGHAIGNHSWSHSRFIWDRKRIREEIIKTDSIIEAITGERPLFFRPPGILCSPVWIDEAKKLGHVVVLGSIAGLEFEENLSKMEFLPFLHPGGIVIMHERKSTIHALPFILERVRREYKIGDLKEVIRKR